MAWGLFKNVVSFTGCKGETAASSEILTQPFVMRLVNVLVDDGVMQPSVDPVNEVIGEQKVSGGSADAIWREGQGSVRSHNCWHSQAGRHGGGKKLTAAQRVRGMSSRTCQHHHTSASNRELRP